MTPSREQLIQHYQRLSDNALLNRAINDASGLVPEAQEVLRAEIRKRGLPEVAVEAVNVQNAQLTEVEIEHLIDAVRNAACPLCGTSSQRLNGGSVSTARSFVVMTVADTETIIACPDCLSASARRASLITLFLGWWGLPWGPFRTIQAFVRNGKTAREAYMDRPSKQLDAFVRANPGAAVGIAAQAV